jgi:hypothetical protein
VFLKEKLISEGVPMEFLPTIIQEVNLNLIEYVIGSLNPENKYHILFDQLDLGFDPSNPEYYNRVIGLLLAAKEINRAAKERGKQLSVIIFLRDDIYNSLKFEDKNKLTQSAATIIEWDLPGGHTLIELVERRLTEVLRESEDEVVKWENVFDEGQLMTGKQTKYNYITDRTFLRQAGGSGYGGSEYIFKYKNTRSQFEESARNYRVHPGLVDFLGLKRSTKPKE